MNLSGKKPQREPQKPINCGQTYLNPFHILYALSCLKRWPSLPEIVQLMFKRAIASMHMIAECM